MKEVSYQKHDFDRSGQYDQKTLLIKKHLFLVDFLVERLAPQLPSFLSRDDIAGAAMEGLIDAANKFDSSKGVMFKTYAEHRIRGAVFDEVRRMDWFTRSLREKQQRLTDTIRKLEIDLNRSPEEEEIASAMEMSLAEYQDLLGQVDQLGWVSLQQTLGDSEEGQTFLDFIISQEKCDPYEQLECEELANKLAQCLREIPEKEQIVISLLYYEELTQKEISQILELTEGRVSQLHSQALQRLKIKLQNRLT